MASFELRPEGKSSHQADQGGDEEEQEVTRGGHDMFGKLRFVLFGAVVLDGGRIFVLLPKEHLEMSGGKFDWHSWGGVLLASSGEALGMLFNTPQSTGLSSPAPRSRSLVWGWSGRGGCGATGLWRPAGPGHQTREPSHFTHEQGGAVTANNRE